MIRTAALGIFLGLLIFGPKKTLEMSQTVARTLANLKNAAKQFQSQMQEEVNVRPTGEVGVASAPSPLTPSQPGVAEP